MSHEGPVDFNKERAERIAALQGAITGAVDAMSGSRYKVVWIEKEESFSLQSFSFTIKIPSIEDVADKNGLYTTAVFLDALPELDAYTFDESALDFTPPRIRFIKTDSIAMYD
jgi:hypothetical protein